MLTVRRAVLCLLWNYASEWMIWQLLDLLSHGPPEEGHDLTAGTIVVGAEQSAADAGGDALLRCPRHCVCIEGRGGNIAELGFTADCGAAGGTIEEGHRLRTGAGRVGAELALACAAGDAVFDRPGNSLGIEGVSGNIREAAHALGSGRTGRTPQEGDDLRAGAGIVGEQTYYCSRRW